MKMLARFLPILFALTFLPGCVRRPVAAGVPTAEVRRPTAAPLFEDVYDRSGVDFKFSRPTGPQNILQTMGHGVALIDYDGDGRLDLLLLSEDRIYLYRNLGDFHFEDVSARAGFRQKGNWSGVAIGDYDNDGRPDIFVCGYDCSALYHNDGDGRFTEVTERAGVGVRPPSQGGTPEWRTSAGFVDYDRDGKLDLFICRYAEFGPRSVQLCGTAEKGEGFSCSPDVYTPQTCLLYRNLGGGRFEDVSVKTGVARTSGRALGVAFADYDNDGWIDIAVANDERPGDLLHNKAGKGFVNAGVMSGTALNSNGHAHGGMGIDWMDYDGDGRQDLFVSTYQKEAKNLFHNIGNGCFLDASLDAGLAEKMDPWVSFGTKFFDYDRDGFPDLIVTSGHVINNTASLYPGTQQHQPVQLFHNSGGNFTETTDRLGPKASRLLVGRSLAVGDLDNDGRVDVVITQNEGPPLILRNMSTDTNHWLSFRLVGSKSNRDGFGARIELTAGGKKQIRDATNSGSYMAAGDPCTYFGLGAAQRADVTVRWPSGQVQSLPGLRCDRKYRIDEAGGAPVVLPDPHP
jgi:hypothetical protein